VLPPLSIPKHNWTGGLGARETAAAKSQCGTPAPVTPSGGLGVADATPLPPTSGLPAETSDGPTAAASLAQACPLPAAPAMVGAAVDSAAAKTSVSSPDQSLQARSSAGGGSCARSFPGALPLESPSSPLDPVESDHAPATPPSLAEGPTGLRVGRSKNVPLATRSSTMACTSALGLTKNAP